VFSILAIALCYIAALGIFVYALGRVLTRLTRNPNHKNKIPRNRPLGHEAIDYDRFELETRPTILGGTGLAGTNLNSSLDAVVARSNAYAKSQKTAAPRAPRVSPHQSAERLVKGIAQIHDVALFTSGPLADDPDDPTVIMHDLLTALELTVRLVDVTSDAQMHLGLPHLDDEPVIPHLYINASAVGGAEVTLQQAQSGELAARLKKAKIPFNHTVAAALQGDS
jgi:glutaredoxin-related protein